MGCPSGAACTGLLWTEIVKRFWRISRRSVSAATVSLKFSFSPSSVVTRFSYSAVMFLRLIRDSLALSRFCAWRCSLRCSSVRCGFFLLRPRFFGSLLSSSTCGCSGLSPMICCSTPAAAELADGVAGLPGAFADCVPPTEGSFESVPAAAAAAATAAPIAADGFALDLLVSESELWRLLVGEGLVLSPSGLLVGLSGGFAGESRESRDAGEPLALAASSVLWVLPVAPVGCGAVLRMSLRS
ncbi:unnamed protein product [Chondrus crispus]|uniref:Uncharacterized protein n=1 Tax=Chondrus crispus TaxID=2769 RepID=R7Q3W6_CHOCR|nr:unnamed protein product [Chondrus crispus]CDF33227.1 unnamed protein product [Chondrus crispus]|eukprot:XP_005713030.1 unnamed protein product [Chondrus crispus]